ncbi:hypothetical protein J6590_057322 [Homalodisca vitripennis]|nr:hypothetical protein J6590_057322 [Homalodisca vitripennis]
MTKMKKCGTSKNIAKPPKKEYKTVANNVVKEENGQKLDLQKSVNKPNVLMKNLGNEVKLVQQTKVLFRAVKVGCDDSLHKRNLSTSRNIILRNSFNSGVTQKLRFCSQQCGYCTHVRGDVNKQPNPLISVEPADCNKLIIASCARHVSAPTTGLQLGGSATWTPWCDSTPGERVTEPLPPPQALCPRKITSPPGALPFCAGRGILLQASRIRPAS